MRKENKKEKIKKNVFVSLAAASLIILGGAYGALCDQGDPIKKYSSREIIKVHELAGSRRTGWQSTIGNGEPAGTTGKGITLHYPEYIRTCIQ